jgi:hypothetical protein
MNEPQYNEHDPEFQQWLKRNDLEPTAPVEIEPRCLFSDGLDEPCPICAAPVSWVGGGYFVA